MGTQTKYLQLYKPAKTDYYNVETDQNENFDKIDKKIEEMDEAAKEVKELANTKEDKFDKKSGFNLDKSDSVSSNSSNTLATSLAVKTAYDKASNAERIANTKEPAFSKKSGFNLEKTSDYKSADDNKVFTQQGANSLYKKLEVDDYYIAFNLNQIKRNFKSLSATHMINNESPELLLELLLGGDVDGAIDVIWETIYNGNISDGTFTTSKSIWDYNYIQIIGSDDDENYIWVSEHRIKDMRYCLENWKGMWFLLENGNRYWGISSTKLLADGRTFYAEETENCRIYQIRVR